MLPILIGYVKHACRLRGKFRGQSSEVIEGIIVTVVLHLLLQPDVVWVDGLRFPSCQGRKHGLGSMCSVRRESGKTD